jgi:cytidylate kinase
MPEGRQEGGLIVALDGPAGAGKSTVAKRLAKELRYRYVDTGAMYRAIALSVVQAGVDLSDEDGVRTVLENSRVELVEENGFSRVLLNDRDVTGEIRTPELSQMASKVSSLGLVREKMVELQRAIGFRGGIVAEGRDIGTVVFPQADIKIYLDASVQERARRRHGELQEQEKTATFEETLKEMTARDHRDKSRAVAPLIKAEDALVIDSTSVQVDSVVELILAEIKKKKQKFYENGGLCP